MTLATTTNRNDYQGTGITGPFPYTFRIFAATDLQVVKRSTLGAETTLALTTDYTVTGVALGSGGTVTLSVALQSGESLTIRRAPSVTQPTSLRNEGAFLPDIHEDALDRVVMIAQDHAEQLRRAFQLPVTAPASLNPVLPTPAPGNALGWDGSGTSLVNIPTIPGQQIQTAVDPQDLKTKFPVPALDTVTTVHSEGGLQRFNESGLWDLIADSPTGYVTPQKFRHKAWGSTYFDGAFRYLTQAEIAAHPEWIGKYLAGVNTREDPMLQESVFAGYANVTAYAKTRGQLASTSIGGDGNYTFTLQFDGDPWSGIIAYTPGSIVKQGALYYVCILAHTNQQPPNATYWALHGDGTKDPMDVNSGLVRSLPIAPAGPYNNGVQGAAFYTIDNAGGTSGDPFFIHRVDSNTANTVTLNEAQPFHLMQAGDHFELVMFNGTGARSSNRKIEAGRGHAQITRGLVMEDIQGHKFFGHGRFALTITQNRADTPHFPMVSCEYGHFAGFMTDTPVPNNRPQFDVDATGASYTGGCSNQSNYWTSMYFQGTLSMTARLGTAGAPIAITGVGGNTITCTTPRALKQDELANCYVVIDSCPGDAANGSRRLGFRYLVKTHPPAAQNAAVILTLYDSFTSQAPVGGGTPDTFHVEVGATMAIEFAAWRVSKPNTSGPQGSEMKVEGFYATSFCVAAFKSTTGNALQQSYMHGNIASCPNRGIWHIWGNLLAEAIGFQSGTDPVHNQINYAKSHPSTQGYDIYLNNSALENSSVHACRSEGMRFLRNDGFQLVTVRDCDTSGYILGPFSWTAGMNVSATSAGIGVPTMTQGSGTATRRDGNLWVCATINNGAKTSTTTSNTEPIWENVGTLPGYGSRAVNETGAGGGGDTINWMNLDTWISWLHNNTNESFCTISGTNISLDNFQFNYCSIQLGGNRIGRIKPNRRDWYSAFTNNDWTARAATRNYFRLVGPVLVNPPSGPSTWGLFSYDHNRVFDTFPTAERIGSGDPFAWDVGHGGGIVYQIGIGPGARETPVIGYYGMSSTGTDLSAGVLAPMAPRIVKDAGGNAVNDFGATAGTNDRGTSGLTDLPGYPGQLGGGLGTGAGAPGTLDLLIGVATTTGTTEQAYTRAARIDAALRLVMVGAIAPSGVLGTINIAGGGTATPNPNGAEVYRYNLQGATATVNNPVAALIDCQGFEIEFLNGAGVNSTVTFGSMFLMGATSTVVAAGKWMTFSFRYDATLGKFKLKNANGL